MSGMCIERRPGGALLATGLAFIGAGAAGVPALLFAGMALVVAAAARCVVAKWSA